MYILKRNKLLNLSTEQCLASSANYLPPTPSPPSECVLPGTKGGGYTSPGGEGMGGNIWEDARHWIGLLQYNPSKHGISLRNISPHLKILSGLFRVSFTIKPNKKLTSRINCFHLLYDV